MIERFASFVLCGTFASSRRIELLDGCALMLRGHEACCNWIDGDEIYRICCLSVGNLLHDNKCYMFYTGIDIFALLNKLAGILLLVTMTKFDHSDYLFKIK